MRLTKDESWLLHWWLQNSIIDIPREFIKPDEKKLNEAIRNLHEKLGSNSDDKRRESKSGRVKMDTIDDCIKRLNKKNTHN